MLASYASLWDRHDQQFWPLHKQPHSVAMTNRFARFKASSSRLPDRLSYHKEITAVLSRPAALHASSTSLNNRALASFGVFATP
ncbi:hypothetical protein CPB83DRAFT_862533 [Crepidotus variabilis]|uniref:Uncharacterized protein n=1 Tax=Crepidotus variabilis TaxID=179855 RepID=A0A9P6E6Q0_9AGAR|nr:hypothetical protein CPB83DRAFT_862533 [Crepidotus variabilis]